MAKNLFRSLLLVVLALGAACTVHNTDVPGLSGPSQNVGVVTGPSLTPTARFTVSPTNGFANSPMTFNGTNSCVGPADPSPTTACSSSGTLTYFWDFGDGSTATGGVVSHAFDIAQTYAVRLTVTNASGKSHTSAQAVTVGAGLLPTAAFTASPTGALVGQAVVFNASTSTAGVGHTVTGFFWEFGDNTPAASGQVVTHAFLNAGSYVVTLTVVDEEGQATSTTRTIAVGTSNPTAKISLVKSGGNSITADASQSTAVGSAQIVTYSFNWGDGSGVTSGSASVVPHTFPAPGTYTVALTVTDDAVPARSNTVTASVTVP